MQRIDGQKNLADSLTNGNTVWFCILKTLVKGMFVHDELLRYAGLTKKTIRLCDEFSLDLPSRIRSFLSPS